MRGAALTGIFAISLVVAAQAHGGKGVESSTADRPAPDWSAWTRPLAPSLPAAALADAPAAEIDVVDAHWMALTMWGEARGGGEEAMRAVGHVIANRSRAGLQGRYVTETVSEAFQFSCWNPGDPNQEAMLNVESLPRDGRDHAMWLAARRLAGEILAGSSADPTGGALFYHSIAVSPRWSQGVPPTVRIGAHLFFRAARRA